MTTAFHHRCRSSLLGYGLLAATLLAPPALAQSRNSARDDRANGFKENPRMLAAFREAVAGPSRSVVRVRSAVKDVALGTVVAADGWILTKNSELVENAPITVVLKDGRQLPAKLVGVQDRFDLAMLKIDATDLTPVQWGDAKSAPVGEILASPGVTDEPLAIGVLSVASRAVRSTDLMIPPPPANAGYLGVALDEAEGGARVASVMLNSAAYRAGLKVDDVVTLIADTPIIDLETMINTIRHHKPGDAVPITVKRGDKEIELKATLDKRPPDPGLVRREYQNHLGSALSERRSGFPTILQHDMVLRPDACGGPVVDLDGKTLGINIARAGRVESYAIPAESVKGLIEDLKSGKLAPAPKRPATTGPTLAASKNDTADDKAPLAKASPLPASRPAPATSTKAMTTTTTTTTRPAQIAPAK